MSKGILDCILSSIEGCAKEHKIVPGAVSYAQLVKYMVRKTHDKNDKFDLIGFQRDLKQNGGFQAIRDSHFAPVVTTTSILNAKQAKDNRWIAKDNAQQQIFFERFDELFSKLTAKPIVGPVRKLAKIDHKAPIQRNLHLLLSDTHFGAHPDPREGLGSYEPLQQSRSLAQVIRQTCDWKPQYRKDTKLYVNLGGDIIQGVLHDMRDGFPLAEQSAMAIWYFTQAITALAAEFPRGVEVHCATGNHDRNKARHPERATFQKWDSIATIIYFGIKQALKHIPNVKVHIPRTPWITYQSFGANYYGTHGDTHINIGFPGSSINVRSLENQINKLNASLPDSQEYKVVFVGHVHTGLVLKLTNGVVLLANPPLIPVDSYGKSVGIAETPTAQLLWESVEGHPFGDSRFLEVNQQTYKDSSLDKIIKPFVDF